MVLNDEKLKAPFPYFGGKSTVAHEVWKRFGNVRNYVEPFFGSGAVLLGRPLPFDGVETVNDIDGMVSNFWRAVKHDPESVAYHADWPVIENDLHARHAWLIGQKESLRARLEGDPEYYDAKIAGWWCWGACCWIGSGFCSGNGPWVVKEGQLVHLGNAGKGVHRNRVHLGDAGKGVNRKRVHLGNENNPEQTGLIELMNRLHERIRFVRVCCGSWDRVCGDCVTVKHGKTAVFLDPPYADTASRTKDLYSHDSFSVAHEVREWCISNGNREDVLIALAGYEGEHVIPDDWECFAWKASGGYASQGSMGEINSSRERIWFSPHCLKVNKPTQKELF